ncbi:unnamed protein product [Periconia digitata]|uniref:Uncharacterized protein n=1 Tax=Periconia digitata TaxID=1303443 RepID=A0A9W4UAQ7_9PLEO|nr:unnamed protein product [Periconia digitata]
MRYATALHWVAGSMSWGCGTFLCALCFRLCVIAGRDDGIAEHERQLVGHSVNPFNTNSRRPIAIFALESLNNSKYCHPRAHNLRSRVSRC